MPIIRKIIPIGDSFAVTIPKSWLEYHQRQHGKPIREVAIEVNRILKIKPMPQFPAERKERDKNARRSNNHR